MAGTGSFRAASNAASEVSGSQLTVSVPTGVVNGDLLVICVDQSSVAAPLQEAGWSVWFQDGGVGGDASVATRTASSEPASYTFDWPAAESWRIGIMLAYKSDVTVDVADQRTADGTVTVGSHADADIGSGVGALSNRAVIYFATAKYSGPPFNIGAVTWTADTNAALRAETSGITAAEMAAFDEYIASSADHPARAFDIDWDNASQDIHWHLMCEYGYSGGGPTAVGIGSRGPDLQLIKTKDGTLPYRLHTRML